MRLTLAIAIAAATFFCMGCFEGFIEPGLLASDADLEARFREILPDLEMICDMAKADPKVTRIASDFTLLDDNAQWPRSRAAWGITTERWSEYRVLFSKIGCPFGIFRRDDALYVICSSRGLATDGVSKGYAHLDSQPQGHLAESLDAELPANGRPYFKPLERGWYLYLD